MQQLVHGEWPKLQSLDLSDNILNDAAIGHLVKGKWPQLEHLWVTWNCVTLAGLLSLPAAQWPCTKSLVITRNDHRFAAPIDLEREGDASVNIQFDADLIVFKIDMHTTKYVSFYAFTCAYNNTLQTLRSRFSELNL